MDDPRPAPAPVVERDPGRDGGRAVGPSPADGLRVLVPGVSWPLETFVERLLTGLSARGHRITLLSPARPDARWMSDHGMTWEYGPAPLDTRRFVRQVRRNGALPSARLLSAAAGRRRVGRGHISPAPPLAGFHVLYAPWINVLAHHPDLLRSGPPVVTSCRGSLITIAPLNPDRRSLREALPRVFEAARLVHCVSDHMLAAAGELGLDPGKARVIRPGVDPRLFPPVAHRGADRPMRAISCGNLTWVKDHETALVALRRAVDRGADITLDVIGDGPTRTQLLYDVDDLDLADRVRLLGKLPVDEVVARLARADVFVHTSSSEGISNAVLEAMSSGLAVITTDAGGMGEAVRHEIDGLVVPVRGGDAAADALVRLAADPELRARLGGSARQRVMEGFRLDQQVDAFDALLREASGR